jgi:hypothetical protein
MNSIVMIFVQKLKIPHPERSWLKGERVGRTIGMTSFCRWETEAGVLTEWVRSRICLCPVLTAAFSVSQWMFTGGPVCAMSSWHPAFVAPVVESLFLISAIPPLPKFPFFSRSLDQRPYLGGWPLWRAWPGMELPPIA